MSETIYTKICSLCGEEKFLSKFYRSNQKEGKKYWSTCCKICKPRNRSHQRRAPVSIITKERRRLKLKTQRLDPDYRAVFILSACRSRDKQRGLLCNLTVEWVASRISKGCFYCGSQDGQMVLDRRDNKLGHTMDNVNPACFRCNYMRMNMPYLAWTALVPSIKTVYESGLFGEWRKRKT